MTYDEFWLHYLREHAHPKTRALHYVASACAVFFVALAIVTFQWWPLIAAPVSAYAFAWSGHFLIERNNPTAMKHPSWSFYSDWKMAFLWCLGRLQGELVRAGADRGVLDPR